MSILGGLDNLLSLRALGGTFAQLRDALDAGQNCTVFSLNRPQRMHVAAYSAPFVVYVTRDTTELHAAYSSLKAYFGDRIAMLHPNQDVLMYHKAYRKSDVGERVRALWQTVSGQIDCLVTSPQAWMQYYPDPQRLRDAVIRLEVGQTLERETLIAQLVRMGYRREDSIEEKNTFTVAGDTVSVFAPDRDMPVRISFFDDQIETMMYFDPQTRMRTTALRTLTIVPENDLLFRPEEWERALQAARKDCGRLSAQAMTRAQAILDELALSSACDQPMQWLLPYLTDRMVTLQAYLPAGYTVVLDEPSVIAKQLTLVEQEHSGRVRTLEQDGDVLHAHMRSILSVQACKNLFVGLHVLGLSNLVSTSTLYRPDQVFDIQTGNLGAYRYNSEALGQDLTAFRNSRYTTVICMGNRERALSLMDGLRQEDVPTRYADDVDAFVQGTFVTPIALPHGFVYPSARLAVIGTEDVLRTRSMDREKKKRVFTMPKVGDYVVHEIHGIGRCLGTKRVKTGTIEQDYVVCEYRGGDLLYVPIDQMDRISRYSGSDIVPKLSAIGGKDFERVKESVRKSVREMAINLVDLYSKRQQRRGYRYPKDCALQQEFEDAFEYEETPDQLTAIQDCKSDMESGKIMDRLLCGDVGYGKTEVALRIVFKTVLENKQAVILAPTTVLARQHYNTACARLGAFGVNVELLSRFCTPEQIRTSLENLRTGKSQVAVATHRILSEDVQFSDLGLLVLDEEHRFGVEHKEKLKVLKNNVNVLSMSATPIPRTLNMALSGIRDISVLETPPRNRLPVQTAVTDLTDGLLQDAIGRELARGGQVFLLHNFVSSIDAFAAHVAKLVPQARIVVGHGKMSADQLEMALSRFYTKEADVFICTTIIENGIDIPDANTLIVCDADRLGLSQLYQLRGRVGRSNRLAYAYFTVPEGKVLTETASKRLNAILDYTELGSGFQIAMRDLEIRGAGNILGREQHGHIQKVGYDLYCKLLQETVDEMRGIEQIATNDVQMQLDVDAYLDSSYIADENMRLRIYREIAGLENPAQAQTLQDNLRESYGALPQSLRNLIQAAWMKNVAARVHVTAIRLNATGAGFTFGDDSCYRNSAVMTAVADAGDRAVLTYGAKPQLVFDCRYASADKKLQILCDFMAAVNKNTENDLQADGHCV